MSHERIEQQLYDIDNNLSNIATILDRLATALERMAPKGSEREQVALRLDAERAFKYAAEWIAERDKQRAQQAE